MRESIKTSLGYELITTLGAYKIYKSRDLNSSFCYVDNKHNRINEPIYSVQIETKNGTDVNKNGWNIRHSEYALDSLIERCKGEIELYESKRKESLLTERKYRQYIHSIEPINYKFENLTLTVITKPCYYSGGHLVTKRGSVSTDKKVLQMYIDGKTFNHDKVVVNVDAEISEDLILDKIFFANNIKHNWDIIDITGFKTIEMDMFVPFRHAILGLKWKVSTENEPITITNVMCYSNTYGIANCTVYDTTSKNQRRCEVLIKDLQPQNIVGKISEVSPIGLSVLMNKFSMLD